MSLGGQAVAGLAAPLAEQAARGLEIADLERRVDVGEEVALLPEAHGHVQHGDVQREREQRIQRSTRSRRAPTRRSTSGSAPRHHATMP